MTGSPMRNTPPRALDGGDQGLDQPPVLHLVHPLEEQAAPCLGRQHGLERADLLAGELLDRETQFLLVAVPLIQFFGFLVVKGDLQPCFGPVLDVDAGFLEQRGGPVRVQIQARQAQVEIVPVNGAGALRRKHTSGGPGSFLARLARIHEGYACSAAQQFVGDGESDHARAYY